MGRGVQEMGMEVCLSRLPQGATGLELRVSGLEEKPAISLQIPRSQFPTQWFAF